MSEMDSSEGIASGTVRVMEHMTPGAAPSSREYDGRDAGDVESARAGVDLLFASITARLCRQGTLLEPDRNRLLWNAVEYLRSHVGRLDARLGARLEPRQPEQQDEAARDTDTDADPGDEEFLLAEQAEGIKRQIDVLKAALDRALMRYGEVVERPWLARHDSLDMQGSAQGLGAQIDASAFFEARELWQPAPDTLTRVREAMEEQAEKRARLRAAAMGREAPEPLADMLPPGDGANEDTAAAVAQTFQALSLVYPDGTQLQDERAAGAWRLVRLFDSAAEQTSVEAMRRMPGHPALLPDGDAETATAFDDESRSFMLRIEMLARAADAAGALYLETTGEEWERRDAAMTAAGGPRTPAHAGLTGEHYAATHRAAQFGRPSPLPLDGPHIVLAGGAELDPDANRGTIEAVLTRLHERIPGMVLHYGARLQDPGGKPRRQGVDPVVRRWATARGVPLIPHSPEWDADNGRYDIHSRDDGWVAMKPDLVFDFGGGNAHQRFLALARRNGINISSVPALVQPQVQRISTPSVTADAEAQEPPEPRILRWAGIGSRGTDKEPVPQSVLADMTELARRMAAAGWHLSSGGADGSDTAFANGTPVDQRTIWLPWPGYNDLSGPDCHPIPQDRLQQSLELAERFHPTWDRLKQSVRKLHARNGLIVLGRDLDKPVDAVVAYTQGGKLQGGTAQGLRIAMEHNIPIINLGSMTMEQAWEKLQALQQRPPAMRTVSTTRSTDAEKLEQRRDLRQQRAMARVQGMLRDFDITKLSSEALAELNETGGADLAADERLHALSADQLVDGLDRLQAEIEQLREDMPAGAGETPEGREAAIRIAAMEQAADRFHTVLADKTLADMREEDSLDTRDEKLAPETQQRTLAVMLSVWRLARQGPLAMESNRIVREAAKAFASQHSHLDGLLAAETRERSGLGLEHAPGSAEETAALARGAADDDAGEAYDYMRTGAERQKKDDEYGELAVRTRRFDVMARTAQTFSDAVRVDMRRDFNERERRRTQHLDGAGTPDAVRGRERGLQMAHEQLVKDIFRNLDALCPADHVSGEDRDWLLSRFAGFFRKLEREFDADIMRTSRTGKGADRFHRHREAAAHMRILAGHAAQALVARTGQTAHVWESPTTQNAGEWLMERLRRARDRRKAETLAPEGRHLAIVGGRALGDRHAQRIAALLNIERARNPETPLVLHCIEQEGAGLHAARWAAMHGVACVTHRPKRYTTSHLRKRDAQLLSVPLETLWNFGADSTRDRAVHMLVEAAGKAERPIEIRDMQPETDGLLSSETVIDPPLAVEREFDRIYGAWNEAEKAAGEGALIYRPGMEELRPDIDRILASPHLTGAERNFLTNFKAVLDSESSVRAEIDSAIERGRNHLAQYEAMMEQRGPHIETTALFDADPDYRKWELHAGQIAKTFENWFAIEGAGHRDHVDRRRLDLTDIAAEISAIRKAARSSRLAPHRVEIPLEAEPGPVDQRFDPKRCSGLMDWALLPEDERDPRAVVDLARWSRAWPKETLGLFRVYVDDAAQAGQTISTHRLAFGLSPALAAGMSQISEEIWAREAVAIGERQMARERGRGMSA